MKSSVQFLLVAALLLIGGNVRSYVCEISSNCGVPKNVGSRDKFGDRIVGGKEVNVGELPWQAYLNKTIYYKEFAFTSFCGATIISKDYLLTGGHCVFDFIKNDPTINVTIEAIFGSVDLSTNLTKRMVVDVVRRKDFDYNTKLNDIALLKLGQSLDFAGEDRNLAPICLSKSLLTNTTRCVSSGFGYRNKDLDQLDNKLHSVPERMVSNTLCHTYFDTFNDTTNLCVEGSLNQGLCKGDSGGPYQCQSSGDHRWYQVGIVSYGIPCALDNVPDVLTKVDFFYDWIHEHISH